MSQTKDTCRTHFDWYLDFEWNWLAETLKANALSLWRCYGNREQNFEDCFKHCRAGWNQLVMSKTASITVKQVEKQSAIAALLMQMLCHSEDVTAIVNKTSRTASSTVKQVENNQQLKDCIKHCKTGWKSKCCTANASAYGKPRTTL